MRQITKLNAVAKAARKLLNTHDLAMKVECKLQLRDALDALETTTKVNQKLIYVEGEGSSRSPLVIVGEAPGATEEAQGRPFVGQSGELLRTTMIELGFDLETLYYITNVVKVRPEDNRTPTREELASWKPLLMEELKEAKLIMAVGRTAERVLKKDPRMRFVLHPAYVLRNRKMESKWKGQLKEVLDELRAL
jgi:uracil-DNA glycosylase family 4